MNPSEIVSSIHDGIVQAGHFADLAIVASVVAVLVVGAAIGLFRRII